MNQEMLNQYLINACYLGNLELVKKLVNDGADIHYEKPGYCTAFEQASRSGHLEIVKWLYEQDADPTTDNNYAIRIASQRGHLEVVKWLYSIGCDPTVYDNFAIRLASMNGHLELVKYLYSIGCDPTANNNYAIRYASERGHLKPVKYLYSIGCDPTAGNNYAILLASENGHLGVVKFLALVGCDINVIENPEHKKTAEYYKKYKPIMDQCIIEIYGNPRLERTKTENEISFREFKQIV